MIRFILLQNRQGKTRLAKYYVPLQDGEKRKIEYDVHQNVANRDAKFTNFVEVSEFSAVASPLPNQTPLSWLSWGHDVATNPFRHICTCVLSFGRTN
mmetsp:Transcript_13300/g.33359  ORF Transcript_13300/g.33359 Transcript_13300/m.33359 type:complete len:97 (+) Transcript_13300:140-430(+)